MTQGDTIFYYPVIPNQYTVIFNTRGFSDADSFVVISVLPAFELYDTTDFYVSKGPETPEPVDKMPIALDPLIVILLIIEACLIFSWIKNVFNMKS